MARLLTLFLTAGLAILPPVPAEAAQWKGLFDVTVRAAELQTPQFARIKAACLAIPADAKWSRLRPIGRLSATDGYGSDQAAEDFSWAVMVLSGRALAGDKASASALTKLLVTWADAGAFSRTEEANDAYYALKRQLLPISVAYGILLPTLDTATAGKLEGWIDPLVRSIDKIFDGDVDRNNHRVLADSVMAVWGAITGDDALMQKGLSRYQIVLDETRPDGTLELEARRGARALWYQRQTLSSLVIMAETARGQGIDLYAKPSAKGQTFSTLLGALLNGISAPVLVAVYSAENYIPGPEKDYLNLDMGFLKTRGHGRHYMAWTEAVVGTNQDLSFQRLKGLFTRDLVEERPLVDEFAGGNATCFWGQP